MFGKAKKTFSNNSIEFLVVGLGNPDRKYENTRHNAGFMMLDYIADKFGARVNRVKFKSTVGEGRIGTHRVLFMKPSTYMNNSGEAVVEAMNFYKIPAENVVVLLDDINLDVGKMRIRSKGSDGGQNGMKNIIYLSGSDKFPRVKIGIGNKPNPNYDLAAWVLSKFTNDELKTLEKIGENTAEAVQLILDGKTQEAMNRFN
ncbi:MAG: aminoacyl-tRNA hydrolase [Ruminococcus sp.]|nr:aminoacyl-tRNA hydrolase [Ruminococcus sp.]